MATKLVSDTPPDAVSETPPDAPTETPTETPTPEVEEAAEELQAFTDFLEEEVSDDLDLDEETKEPEVVEAKKPEKPEETPPEVVDTTPPAEPKPEVVEPKPEEPPVAVQPAPQEVPVAAPAAAPTISMDEIRANYQKHRTEMESHVAVEVYGLSEDQVQRLDDGDAQLIPELMAKVYMDATTGAVAHMVTHLPQMIENVMKGRDSSSGLESKFYDFWPGLNQETHGETIKKFGMSYRQMFPAASVDDFIRDVGAQTMVALKIVPTEQPTPAAQPATTPATVPFQPAKSGGGGGAAVPTGNAFADLAEEMAEEELDLD